MTRAVLIVLALTLVLSGSTQARNLGLPNQLMNGSWELGDLTGWTAEYEAGVKELNGIYDPGPAPGEQDNYAYCAEANFDCLRGIVTQEITVATPGDYGFEFNGWYCVNDWSGLTSSVQFLLLADGVVVDDYLRWQDTGTTWHQVALDYHGFVSGSMTVRINVYADGDDHYPGQSGYAGVFVDGLDLEGRLTPEPASFLVLLGGLAAIPRRKRVQAS